MIVRSPRSGFDKSLADRIAYYNDKSNGQMVNIFQIRCAEPTLMRPFMILDYFIKTCSLPANFAIEARILMQ